MLGGFSLSYEGKPVTLERNSGTKATQLLQYLIYHKGERVPRDKLVEVLYADDDISNPQNNLKVNIFRLRKLLAASQLPEYEYIVHKNGTYSWQSEIDIEIDAIAFAHVAHEGADFRRGAEHRCTLMLRAVDLYTGEFLPMIASEPWVAVESVKYRDMFMTCVNDAYTLLQADTRFEDALEVCDKAIKVCPYDEDLHLKRISALIDLRRYQDALTAYDEASRMFLEDLGVSPSQKMLELYRRITGNVKNSTALINEVKENLHRDNPLDGAYYCNFPGFIDSYLFVSRLVERSGQSIFLMLSTLTDVHGVPLELGDKLTVAADALHGAIQATLRRSDLYTRYSPCQFLMLLIGTNRENCDRIAERVDYTFKESCDIRGVRIQHSFTSGMDLPSPTINVKFNSSIWES